MSLMMIGILLATHAVAGYVGHMYGKHIVKKYPQLHLAKEALEQALNRD